MGERCLQEPASGLTSVATSDESGGVLEPALAEHGGRDERGGPVEELVAALAGEHDGRTRSGRHRREHGGWQVVGRLGRRLVEGRKGLVAVELQILGHGYLVVTDAGRGTNG